MLRAFCILTLALFALAASAQDSANTVPATQSSTNREFYQGKGVVVSVAPEKKKVTIKHEEIVGYMDAMTMPFDVMDTNELNGLQAGDPVTFRVVATRTFDWVDQIKKTGPKSNADFTTGQFRHVRTVEPLNEGDLLPDYHFTNQLGKAISTAQFKGQALAITFLFTRCPYPQYCPLLANNFKLTQQKLLTMPNAPTNWHLLTISFDPEFDTPEVLQRYAEAHEADPNRWTFATGALIDVTAIGEQFGLVFWREQAGVISHNLRVVVIDPTGRVQKIFTGNEWQPDDLVAEMLKAAKAH